MPWILEPPGEKGHRWHSMNSPILSSGMIGMKYRRALQAFSPSTRVRHAGRSTKAEQQISPSCKIVIQGMTGPVPMGN